MKYGSYRPLSTPGNPSRRRIVSTLGAFLLLLTLGGGGLWIAWHYHPTGRLWAWMVGVTVPTPTLEPLQTALIEQARLEEALQRLQDQCSLKTFSIDHAPWTITTASVIGRNALADYPLLILNRGTNDGVQPGMAVTASHGVLLGTIAESQRQTSTLLPLTHPSSRVAASVLSINRTTGIVEGNANLTAQLTFVPRSETLHLSESVITSGTQEFIPRGLIIGQISALIDEPNTIFQRAELTGLLAHDRWPTVGIVIHTAPPPSP